jgi:cytochrome c556
MRSISIAALAAGAVILVAAAVDPKVAIPARQAHMKQVGKAFKAINDQLHAATPDAAVVAANSRALADLAPQVPSWFPRGSGLEAGIKTAAKAEIWAQPDDFKAKAAALAVATANLAAVAAHSSDVATLTPAVRQVGGACKACHTTYKVADH